MAALWNPVPDEETVRVDQAAGGRPLAELTRRARRITLARGAASMACSVAAAGCAIAGVDGLAGHDWALITAVPFLILTERWLT